MTEKLIECVYEYKTKKDFECKDMESDLVQFYSDIRLMMSRIYPVENFGPEKETSLEGAEDMDPNEYLALKTRYEKDMQQIKTGYERIKEKVRAIRQKYRNCVNEGTRSGSGRIIQGQWETLTKIWGGSPAVTKISNCVTSDSLLTVADMSQIENEDMEEISHVDTASTTESRGVSPATVNGTSAEEWDDSMDNDTSPPIKKQKLSSTAKFVDNKRVKLEKNLSANQRDQVLIGLARDELGLKESTVKELAASTRMMERSMQSIATSIESLGSSLGTGLALLARALAQPSTSRQNYNNTFQMMAPSAATHTVEDTRFSTAGMSGHDWESHYSYQNL